MQITLIIEDHLLDRARKATGIQDETGLVRAGLEALIARGGQASREAGWHTTQTSQHLTAASHLKVSEHAIRLRLLSESHADA